MIEQNLHCINCKKASWAIFIYQGNTFCEQCYTEQKYLDDMKTRKDDFMKKWNQKIKEQNR